MIWLVLCAAWGGVAERLPDRSQPPPVLAPTVRALPEPEVHRVGDVAVWLVPVAGARKVEVRAVLHRGVLDLAGGVTPASVALSALLGEATSRRSADALAALADARDLDVDAGLGLQYGFTRVSAPVEDAALAVALAGELLREPAFDPAELRRWAWDRADWYTTRAAADPDALADAALTWAWYPADHPFGARPDLDGIAAVRCRDLRALHATWLATAPATVVLVGDVAWADAEPWLAEAFAGVGVAGEPSPDLPFAPPEATRWVGVDLPEAAEATLRFRAAAPLRDDPDRALASALDQALGGQFASRLNAVLREEKGWTYGASSSYLALPTRGSFTVSVSVPAAVAPDAIAVIDAEIARLAADGATREELASAWRAGVGEWNETLLTSGSAGEFYWDRLLARESVAAAAARLDRVASATPEDLRRVAATWLGAEAPRVWVIVGDQRVLAPALAAAGFEVTWVSAADAALGRM